MTTNVLEDHDIQNMTPTERENLLAILRKKQKIIHNTYQKVKEENEKTEKNIETSEGQLLELLSALSKIKNITDPTNGELSENLKLLLPDETLADELGKRSAFKKTVKKEMDTVLDDKEKKQIKDEFTGKSFQEIQEALAQKQDKSFFKKTLNIFGPGWFKLAVGVAVAALCIRMYVKAPVQKSRDTVPQRSEEKHISPPQKLKPTTPAFISAALVKKHIPQNKIGKGVTYQQIANAVNRIKTPRSNRIKLIKYLIKGDIFLAQEWLGMKRYSSYASNKATGIIDKNTLDRFSNKMFGLYGDEILQHRNIPLDVKEVYFSFFNGEINNNNHNYVIISKTDFKSYIFTSDHKLLNVQVVLVGKKHGDDPFILHKSKTTPAGFYRIEYNNRPTDNSGIVFVPGTMKNGKHGLESGPGRLLDLLPIDIRTGKYNGAYDIKKGVIAIHPTPQHLYQDRKSYIESPTRNDNHCTGGCINASWFAILYDNLQAGKHGQGSIIYITPEHYN